jgi:hypothetical protein
LFITSQNDYIHPRLKIPTHSPPTITIPSSLPLPTLSTTHQLIVLSSAKRKRQVRLPSPMRNMRWSGRTIPSNVLGVLAIARQRDLLTPKVVTIDATQVIPELFLGERVPEVENRLAGPETVGGTRDFDCGACLAVEPLFLVDVAACGDLGHVAGGLAVDGGIPDSEVTVVEENSVGCEGGASREGEGGEEGCEAHGCSSRNVRVE